MYIYKYIYIYIYILLDYFVLNIYIYQMNGANETKGLLIDYKKY